MGVYRSRSLEMEKLTIFIQFAFVTEMNWLVSLHLLRARSALAP